VDESIVIKGGTSMMGGSRSIGRCASCGHEYTEIELDEIQVNVARGKEPAVDVCQAAGMLGRPGDAIWAAQELRDSAVVCDGVRLYPLTALRRYAEREGITPVPLIAGITANWVRRKAGQ
jgi:hypothetical protein